MQNFIYYLTQILKTPVDQCSVLLIHLVYISIHVLLKMARDSHSAKYLSHKSLHNIQQLEADD